MPEIIGHISEVDGTAVPAGGDASTARTDRLAPALGDDALAAIGERFGVLLAQALSGLLGRTVISPRPGCAIRSIYSAFVASTDDADFCFLLKAPMVALPLVAQPLVAQPFQAVIPTARSGKAAALAAQPGKAVLPMQPVLAFIELPPHLAFAFVDILLGGRDQQVFVPARPLTQAERPLLAKVLEQAAGALIACLGVGAVIPAGAPQGLAADAAGISPAQGQTPASADQIAADQPVVAAVFDLMVGQHEGAIRLCVPCGPLRSAEHQDSSNLSTPNGPLELTVCLETTLPQSDLGRLAPGDVIATDVPVAAQLVVRAGGIPKYVGKLASSDGHRAVAITGNYATKSGQ